MKKRILGSYSLLLLISFAISHDLNAQNKIEREYDIHIKDVPKNALKLIEQLSIAKINWIYEEGQNSQSIEAKFKYAKEWYSVEFDTTGNFQDAEIEINWKDVEKDIRTVIEESLERKTESYKIRKAQLQLKGDVLSVFKVMLLKEKRKEWLSGYELVVNAKVNGVYHQYEFFYDPDGQMQRMQQIELRGTDNLEF
jgi:hypothetical protein